MLRSAALIMMISCLIITSTLCATEDNQSTESLSKEIEKASRELFDIDPRNKFSLYQPTYFVLGKENLKLQFSAKYRLAKTLNIYLAYTQTMFWNVYQKSQPFDDINYAPEIFYRLIEQEFTFFKSIDIGTGHLSNGEDVDKSRSMNRLFLKTNFKTKINRNNILGELKLQQIYSKAQENKDIVNYMGYWELKIIFTHLVVHNEGCLDLEFKIFAGKRIFDINKGGRELGLIYRLGSDNFNPALYVQYFSGYAESLLHYNQKVSQARLGLLLFF